MFWLYFMPLSMDPLSAFCFLPYFVKHLLYFILRYFIQGKVHRCYFGAKHIYLFVITLKSYQFAACIHINDLFVFKNLLVLTGNRKLDVM